MKKIKKILIICFALTITFFLTGCKDKNLYADDEIAIEIKSSYKDKFLNEEFKNSDFNYDNIKNITYTGWYNDRGFIYVRLNKHGEKEIKKAIKHFKQLDFVETCERVPIIKAC